MRLVCMYLEQSMLSMVTCGVVRFSVCRKDFNIEVLKYFIGLHDFRGKSIVDALR